MTPEYGKEKFPEVLHDFSNFVEEFKTETDRASVILGAAKLDTLLSQLLERFLLPSVSSNDELLEGDSPLSTFSARINICCRLGLIGSDFAKSLHLVRRIRNSFAHEIVGVSLQTGSHADRLKSLLLPLHSVKYFVEFRNKYIGEPSPSSDFRACLALMAGRLEGILRNIDTICEKPYNKFILDLWNEDSDAKKVDEPKKESPSNNYNPQPQTHSEPMTGN